MWPQHPGHQRDRAEVATSTGQNDAGVFEFSFRDERYMPCEGAGAVSDWRLELPKNVPRLMNSPTGTAVKLRLTERHLPVFLRSRAITVTAARLLLRTRTGQSVGTASFTVNSAAVSGFVPDTDLGNLPAADVTTAFADGLTGDHTLTLTNAGDLSRDNPQPGDPTALHPEKLTDILLHVELRLV
ncbi:MAG TPA: hypothetical protein VII16_14820 [Actinomycetes bacterium]